MLSSVKFSCIVVLSFPQKQQNQMEPKILDIQLPAQSVPSMAYQMSDTNDTKKFYLRTINTSFNVTIQMGRWFLR
jgi:hypothetical protein